MVPDKQLEALKATYDYYVFQVEITEALLLAGKEELRKAYAALDIYLNKAENTFQDTEGEGF